MERQGEGVLVILAADEIRAGEHVAPLIVAAGLQDAAIPMVQLQEIVGLHEHVVKFEECQAAFQPLLVAFRREHAVDGEQRADIAQKVDVIQGAKPVGVVDDHGAILFLRIEIQKPLHLTFNVRDIVVDVFDGQHFSKVRLAGRVADHARAAAHERDRLVAGPLQMRHRHDRDIMPDVQRIRRRVKTGVKRDHALVKGLVKIILESHLFDESAFPKDVHCVAHG